MRRIIRETVYQQAVVPGKWDPVTGEPLDPDSLEYMATGGLGQPEEELNKEVAESLIRRYVRAQLEEAKKKKKKKKKKRGLWANIQAKRDRGEPPAKPGEEGYPKTLDI